MIDRFRESASFLGGLAKGVPNAFLEAICAETNLQVGSRLLELGCGSGELTAWFALKGVKVAGVDLSEAMIRKAQQQFAPMAQAFHLGDAVDFMLAATHPWNVVLSFESMHIWISAPTLPAALRNALARGGFLVVAWRSLEWEEVCMETIVELFGNFGVPFDDWGFWTCPSLPDVLGRTGLRWRFMTPLTNRVEHSSTVQEVVDFMLGVDRVQDLSREAREELKRQFGERLERLTQGGVFTGTAVYSAQIVELFSVGDGGPDLS